MARRPIRSESVVEQIVSLYAKGKSVREIARKTGYSYGFVHRTLDSAEGVTFRTRGAVRKTA